MRLSTIVAVSTPFGLSGVGVIRVSGKKVRKIFFLVTKKQLRPRYATYTFFYDQLNNVVDKGLVIFFPGPNSFTGEDVLEFHCHGNPLVLYNLVSVVISYGAIEAAPGEFTLRSFYNGKVNLLQVESIYNLTTVQSSSEVFIAAKSLSGFFCTKVNFISHEFFLVYAYVEADVNFVNVFVITYFLKLLGFLIKDLIYCLNKVLIEMYYTMPLYSSNTIVIAGKPNVGKSSLFNLLLEKDSSITSHIPGTTRDVLCEQFFLFNQKVTLVDTAGLNVSPTDSVELEGIKRAKHVIKNASIVLFVFDVSCLNFLESFEISSIFSDFDGLVSSNSKVLYILNKIDLLSSFYLKEVCLKNADVVYTSTITGEGISLLKKRLLQSLELFKISNTTTLFQLKDRHIDSFLSIRYSLEFCIKYLTNDITFEQLVYNFYFIYYEFLKLTGKVYDKKILDIIFSKFCVGK